MSSAIDGDEKEATDNIDTNLPPLLTSLSSLDLTPYRRAIERETRSLESAEVQARTNRQNQKRALQAAWRPQNDKERLEPCPSKSSSGSSTSATPANRPPRLYSSVKAPKMMTPKKPKGPAEPELTYFQHYCLMVARVAETLLIWLGDEETIKNRKQRVD